MTLKYLASFVLSIGLILSAHAQDKLAVAMIADLEGSGEVDIKGQAGSAEILLELPSGSVLTLNADTKLTLFFFASSQEYTYQGPGEIQIAELQPNLISGKEANTRNLNMAKLAGIAIEDEDRIDLGVLKLRNFDQPNLQLVSPINTKVLATHPKFSWLPVEGANDYQFILTNELGKTIANTTVSGNWVNLPKGSKLSPGEEYTWEIITQTSAKTEFRAHAYFSVVDQGVRQLVDSSRPSTTASFSEKIVFARLLEKLELTTAANDIWHELVALKPNSAMLQARTKFEK